MKKIIVKKQDKIVQIAPFVSEDQIVHFESEDKAEDWVEMLSATGCWGLPARPELDAEGKETGVILPAEYTIEIVDITAEHELAQCLGKRKAEYPSAEEFLNAFFDGGDEALESLRQKRLAIKAKYPKP